MKQTIVLCDDDKTFLAHLKKILMRHGFNVITYENGEQLLSGLSSIDNVDLLLLDVILPKIIGPELLPKVKSELPFLKIIMLSGETDVDIVVTCIKNGASDYLLKPFDLTTFLTVIKRVLHKTNDNEMNLKSTNAIKEDLEKLKDKNISIILAGESGTGKEFFAKHIYDNSVRKGRFVAVNCPAIPKELAESELFGHEKGAFTGAIESKIGKLELANGGILFLDEIGDLSLSIQAKLLRCLEERQIVPVGGHEEIDVDFQLIVASSKDLLELVDNGEFRLDLYYRLADFEIKIPTLKERIDELDMFVNLFLSDEAIKNNSKKQFFDKPLLDFLKTYSWPGNIRELKSIVRRITILCDKERISVEDVPERYFNQFLMHSKKENTSLTLEEKNINLISDMLKDNNHNVTAVAKKLGVSRSTIYRKLKVA
jgi:DNA-binding NtrC family response regulator